MRKLLLWIVLLLLAPSLASAVVITVKRLKVKDNTLPIVTLAGTVNQAALDTAMSDCGTGCNLFISNGTTITGHIVIDGDQSTGMVITGPLRPVGGANPIWEAPVYNSVIGTGSNNCSSGETCLDEETQPLICATAHSGTHTGTPSCVEDAGSGGAPNNITITGITFDGRKDEQPAPRPEDCLSTGGCTYNGLQRLVELEWGNDHLVTNNTFIDSVALGLMIQTGTGMEVSYNDFQRFGCHSTDSSCGSNWTNVDTLSGLGRQSDGFGVQCMLGADDCHVHNNTIGYATKMAIEAFGVAGACGTTNKLEDSIFEYNTVSSPIVANFACRPVIQYNTVSGVRETGSEAASVGHGIQFASDTLDGIIRYNTITDVQAHGISVNAESIGTEVLENTITSACATYTSTTCAGISISSGTGGAVDILGNQIINTNGSAHFGIVSFATSSALKFALNRLDGGTNTILEAAIRIDNATSPELRYNVNEWDHDIGDAIHLNDTATALVQADAFNEHSQYDYNATGTAVRLRETGTTSGTIDCDDDLTGSGCYDTYAITYVPDTQNNYQGLATQTACTGSGLGTGHTFICVAQKDLGYLDDSLNWIIDSTKAFQYERTVGAASYPTEAFNHKLVAGVGDIVGYPTHGDPAGDQMRAHELLYDYLADPAKIAIPIAQMIPSGNHDYEKCATVGTCTNGSDTEEPELYQTVFPSSRYTAFGRTLVNAMQESDVLVADTQYDTATDLAVHQRLKPLDAWIGATFMPYNVMGSTTDYVTWLRTALDDYEDDYNFHAQHSTSDDGSPRDGVCSTSTLTYLRMVNQLTDATDHTNGGLGYRATYLTAAGHSVDSDGFFCRVAQTNTAGDTVVNTAANWQSVNDYALGGGDGWVVVLNHDKGAATIHGQSFSPLANSGAGGFGDTHDTNKGTADYDWTETIDLITR